MLAPSAIECLYLTMTELEVQRIPQGHTGNTEWFELKVDHGYADVSFETITSWMGIANIFVEAEFRRQGRAKALLGHVALMAEEFDAKLIYASIVSRESIDAFVAVFGEDNVSVDRLGSYGSIGGAQAFLRVMRYE